MLNLTSQTWLNASVQSRPVWWHYMAVVVPDRIDFPDKGMMYITGNSNTDSPPTGFGEDELLCTSLALLDHAVCSVLFQVSRVVSRGPWAGFSLEFNFACTLYRRFPTSLPYSPMIQAAADGARTQPLAGHGCISIGSRMSPSGLCAYP